MLSCKQKAAAGLIVTAGFALAAELSEVQLPPGQFRRRSVPLNVPDHA
jgi:hypothetical protein